MSRMTTLIILLIVFLFASCSNEIEYEVPEEIKNESISCTYEFGDVNRIFDRSGQVSNTSGIPRFFSGQQVTIQGIELVFNAYLVEYNSIVKEIADYVEGIEANNALMHQPYPGVKYDPAKKYVEIASYYYAGTLIPAFREVRVFAGDYMKTFDSDYWYAKSVTFSPDFSIDISNQKFVRTGEVAIYRYGTMWTEVGPIMNHAENVVENEDGYSLFTYYDSGAIRRETVFSFDLKKQSVAYYLETGELAAKEILDGKGHLLIEQDYENGILASEHYYDEEGYWTKGVEYDIFTGTVSSIAEYTSVKERLTSVKRKSTSYNSDGYKTGEIAYNLSGAKEYESLYDGTESQQLLSTLKYEYYASGKTLSESEFNSDGYIIKRIEYYESGSKKVEIIYDGTSDGDILSYTDFPEVRHFNGRDEEYIDGKLSKEIRHDESGNVSEICEYNPDGYLIKITGYYPSGTKRYESICSGTENWRTLSSIYYDENGDISSSGGYEYDTNGNLSKTIEYDASGNMSDIWEYNPDGYPIKITGYYPSGTKIYESVCSGTENWRTLGRIYYDENGDISSSEEYEYGTNGNLSKTIEYDASGIVTQIMEYNSDGYLVKRTRFYGSGVKKQETIYDGTKSQNKISDTRWDEDGNVIS